MSRSFYYYYYFKEQEEGTFSAATSMRYKVTYFFLVISLFPICSDLGENLKAHRLVKTLNTVQCFFFFLSQYGTHKQSSYLFPLYVINTLPPHVFLNPFFSLDSDSVLQTCEFKLIVFLFFFKQLLVKQRFHILDFVLKISHDGKDHIAQ